MEMGISLIVFELSEFEMPLSKMFITNQMKWAEMYVWVIKLASNEWKGQKTRAQIGSFHSGCV